MRRYTLNTSFLWHFRRISCEEKRSKQPLWEVASSYATHHFKYRLQHPAIPSVTRWSVLTTDHESSFAKRTLRDWHVARFQLRMFFLGFKKLKNHGQLSHQHGPVALLIKITLLGLHQYKLFALQDLPLFPRNLLILDYLGFLLIRQWLIIYAGSLGSCVTYTKRNPPPRKRR